MARKLTPPVGNQRHGCRFSRGSPHPPYELRAAKEFRVESLGAPFLLQEFKLARQRTKATRAADGIRLTTDAQRSGKARRMQDVAVRQKAAGRFLSGHHFSLTLSRSLLCASRERSPSRNENAVSRRRRQPRGSECPSSSPCAMRRDICGLGIPVI